MKPIKNKKHKDPRYFLHEDMEERATQSWWEEWCAGRANRKPPGESPFDQSEIQQCCSNRRLKNMPVGKEDCA